MIYTCEIYDIYTDELLSYDEFTSLCDAEAFGEVETHELSELGYECAFYIDEINCL